MPSAAMPSTALDPVRLRRAAERAVGALKLLANEERMLLLCQLSQGEASVGELEELLDIHQPTLSQQLGVLRNEGVVSTRREGRHVFYRITDRQLVRVLGALYDIYCAR